MYTVRLSRVFAFALGISLAWSAYAREGSPPVSRQRPVQPLGAVRQLVLPPVDVKAELAADEKVPRGTAPLRFAVAWRTEITPATHGTWEQVPGGKLWRLRVVSAGATDLNFGFTTYRLPAGATLHVYAEDEDYVQGPYDERDNEPHGQLWTPVVPGGRAVIELFVPANAKHEPQLVLAQVGLGYRDMFRRGAEKLVGTESHGSCNIDVICPQGDPWCKEIRSVARYSISGTGLCTGTLVMNATGDFRPYFLTANHCGLTSNTAPTVVAYWNYEAPVCGAQSGGSLTQNQSGATFRAARADVDFALIELSSMPSASFNVHYAGWDRSGTAPVGSVGIHHPAGDVKSICINTNLLTTVNSCIGTGGVNSHWSMNWEQGTTEPGSSGSAIWDPNTHLVVGFLSGGGASCETPTLFDCYGKVSVAWTGTTAAVRLRDWLDPLNTGVMSVAGNSPAPSPILAAQGSSLTTEGCSPANGAIDPGETVTVNFALRNRGTAEAKNVMATLLATGGITSPSSPQNYGTLSVCSPMVSRPFTFTASGTCGANITATLQLQTNSVSFGTLTFNFTLGTPGGPVTTNDYTSGALSVAIPDLTIIEVPLTVNDAGAVADVNVRIRLNHTFDADLVIAVVHPDGTPVTLANQEGGDGDNYGSGNQNCTGTFTVFDDAAATPISAGTAPFAGTFRPDQPLSTLNGKPSNGTWKLRITDTAQQDVGTLYCWQLQIARQQSVCCTAAADSDSDGLPDNWETLYFGNLNQGANDDPDGDGFTNLQEFNAGTIPTNAMSLPRITAIEILGANVRISFTTESGKLYDVEWTASVASGSWNTLTTNVAGTGGIVQTTDVGAAGQPARTYRVRVHQ
jgi:subtilisin-like proprotein convertase family protein